MPTNATETSVRIIFLPIWSDNYTMHAGSGALKHGLRRVPQTMTGASVASLVSEEPAQESAVLARRRRPAVVGGLARRERGQRAGAEARRRRVGWAASGCP